MPILERYRCLKVFLFTSGICTHLPCVWPGVACKVQGDSSRPLRLIENTRQIPQSNHFHICSIHFRPQQLGTASASIREVFTSSLTTDPLVAALADLLLKSAQSRRKFGRQGDGHRSKTQRGWRGQEVTFASIKSSRCLCFHGAERRRLGPRWISSMGFVRDAAQMDESPRACKRCIFTLTPFIQQGYL